MIFGGDAFQDWIGEITLMKDLTKTMDITMREQEEEAAAEAAATQESLSGPSGENSNPAASEKNSKPVPAEEKHEEPPPPDTRAHLSNSSSEYLKPEKPPVPPRSASPSASGYSSGTSTPRPSGIPTRLALEDKAHQAEAESRMNAEGMTEEEKLLREKQKKKGGLSREQREELLAFEQERRKQKEERVAMLSQKLINYISVWTETDKGPDVTKAFKEKTRLEVENLKMESFGLEILHAIGFVYVQKAGTFLKTQKFFGIGGMWSRLKDKGNLVKETWGTISTAIDAQMTMEEMVRAEEKGGEDWTDERKAEFEKKVTGKILAAAWRGSKYEVQGVLREVCERVLNDRSVKTEKRIERAQALIIIGDIFSKVSCFQTPSNSNQTLKTSQAARDPDEEGDFMAFEQLMAEAQIKKDKKEERKQRRKEKSSSKEHLNSPKPTGGYTQHGTGEKYNPNA